jgi:hypothetical protein
MINNLNLAGFFKAPGSISVSILDPFIFNMICLFSSLAVLMQIAQKEFRF